MADPRNRLDERRRRERLDAIHKRGRAAFLAGAEGRSRSIKGRSVTEGEIERVTKRYPGE